jgi:uncharacterized membrane protein YcaP (DUF421 family)
VARCCRNHHLWEDGDVSIVPVAADSVPNANVLNELQTALDSPPGLIFDTQMNSHIFSQNRTDEQTSQHSLDEMTHDS